MYRELQRWALIISIAIFIFTILAAFVPQWIVVTLYTRAYGLRSMCIAGYCGAINYAELATHPQCSGGCWSNDFIHRFHVVEAHLWIAIGSLLWAAFFIASGFHRDLLHTARMMAPIIFFLTLSWIALVIAMAVFGSTVDLWNDDAACPYAEGCLYWGPSSVAAFVALGLSFLAWLLAVLSVCVCSARQRGLLLAWSFILSLVAAAFAFGAVLSDYWLYRSLPFTNMENGFSIGPLNTCMNGDCGPTDQIWLLNTSCRAFDPYSYRDSLRARFGVGVAFLCAAIITSLLVFIFAWRNWPMRTFIALVLTLVFLIVGISVLGDTWGWWLGCGNGGYCNWVTLTRGYDCGYGFAFAAALVAILLTAILIIAWIIMWCCRKEDRAPDTTQVAVTTIAQPPAVPVGPRGAAVARA